MDQTLRQSADQAAGAWLDYREGDIRSDRLAGRRAAAGDMALLARRHADFEDGLVSRAKASVMALRERLVAHNADLRRQAEDLSRECDEEIGAKLRECREQRQQAMLHLEQTVGSRSAATIQAVQRREEAERAHRAVRAEVGGRPLWRSFVRVYHPLLAALAVVEVPVNRLAFELFFQEQPAVSLGLALAVGVVLMIFADLIGTLLRRAELPQRLAVHVRRGVAVALLLLLVGGLVYVLASMRQLYVHLLESEQGGSLQDQIQQLTQGGAGPAIASVASVGLGTAGWTLLLINVALFSLGVAASFFRHDPHPDYEKVWRDQEQANARLTRRQTRFERAVAVRTREFDRRLAELDALMRETQARRDQLATQREAIWPFFRDTAGRIANIVRARSLAWLEGAWAAIPAVTGGSVEGLRAISEPDVLSRLTVGQELEW